jgi:hypothetical protein
MPVAGDRDAGAGEVIDRLLVCRGIYGLSADGCYFLGLLC